MFLALLPIILLSIVSHVTWVSFSGILTGGDWVSQGQSTLQSIVAYSFNMWNQGVPLGRAAVDIGMGLPPLWLWKMAEYLHVSYPIGQRLVWFLPMIILSISGSFLLFGHLLKSHRFATLAASLIYNFNVYFLILQISGHMGIALGYSIMPFFIYFSLRLIEEQSWKYVIYAAFALFFLGSYEPRIAYIGLGIFLVIAMVSRLHVKYIFSLIVLFVLLSAFSFVPVLFSGIYENNGLTSQSLFWGQFMSLSNSIALFHSFWGGGKLVFFSINSIPLHFWMIPFLALGGMALHAKARHMLAFWVLAIVGIFLTKQSAAPLPGFYQWAYDHIPVFNLFRESSKFYIILILAYSALVGHCVRMLFEKRAIFGYIAVVSVFLYAATNALPLITQEAETMFVAREIPKDYVILNEYLKTDPRFSRIAVVPSGSRWIDYSDRHLLLPANVAITVAWAKLFQPDTKDLTRSLHAEIPLSTPYRSDPESVIRNAAIGYIVVPIQDPASETNSLYLSEWTRKRMIATFDRLSFLHRLDLWFQELVVYKVDDRLLVNHIQGIGGVDVRYSTINSTEHQLEWTISGTGRITFLEAFHPGWKLSLEPYVPLPCEHDQFSSSGTRTSVVLKDLPELTFSLTSRSLRETLTRTQDGFWNEDTVLMRPFSVLLTPPSDNTIFVESPEPIKIQEAYRSTECPVSPQFFWDNNWLLDSTPPVFDEGHSKVFDYANEWAIDQAFIESHASREFYHKNSDGSISVRMKLVFRPQSYFRFGLLISGITLTLCLGYLSVAYFRRRRLIAKLIKE